MEVSGKRGITALESAKETIEVEYTHFEDKPGYDEIEVLANKYLEEFESGQIDRFDVAYMQFQSTARQNPVVEHAVAANVAGG